MEKYELATFAGGCFWCMVKPYHEYEGVLEVLTGYTGGRTENPTYEAICSGTTGHYEAVQIKYDPGVINYETLLGIFWSQIDPTDPEGQFADKGSQYKTAIFYHNEEQKRIAEKSKSELQSSGRFSSPIVTEIIPASTFYTAEVYHQDYYKKNPVHYKLYHMGSGRESFIKKHWKENPK